MLIQDFLKEKIREANITQEDVALRINWTKQNVNYKLNHTGSRFSSMLLIAEGIGLSCKIRDIDDRPAAIDEYAIIKKACGLEISTEIFQSMLSSMGYEMVFDWRKLGDIIYMLKLNENELRNHNQ